MEAAAAAASAGGGGDHGFSFISCKGAQFRAGERRQKRPILQEVCTAGKNNDENVQCSDYEVQKRRGETALILTVMSPPTAGDYGLIQKVMMGRNSKQWGEEEEEMETLSPADSDSLSSRNIYTNPHSTVVVLRRTRASRTSESGPFGASASVTMLEGDTAGAAAASSAASARSAASGPSSKWRLPLVCLLLAAFSVAVVAPAFAALSRHDRDARGGGGGVVRSPVSDSGKQARHNFRHSKAPMRIGAVTRDFSVAPWI